MKSVIIWFLLESCLYISNRLSMLLLKLMYKSASDKGFSSEFVVVSERGKLLDGIIKSIVKELNIAECKLSEDKIRSEQHHFTELKNGLIGVPSFGISLP